MLSVTSVAQDFVRPWVVQAPKKAAGTLDSPFLRRVAAPQDTATAPKPAGRRISLPESLLQPAGFPFPIVIAPCTSFPGNPVFIIEGDKVTMRKDLIR